MWLRGLLLKLERYGIKGNILQWIGSYISAREQQVIIENVISGKGNLKAEVSQGSILGPLFFLIFINDIADETIGLCRLLADDTSIGEKSYEMNSLCNMPDKPPLYFSTGIIIANILHARLRQKCSSLKCDLFRCNLIASCNCDCGNYIESFDHLFLKCNIYTEHRIQLFRGMSNLDFDIGIENILFGNASFENDKNSKKSLKIPKGQSETVYRRRTDNTMAKRKGTKGKTTNDKAYI